MTDISSFSPACTLGEGPLWHPQRQQLFWFDIPAGILCCADQHSEHNSRWNFGEAASATRWVDKSTLIVATASGLQKFDIDAGIWETLVPLEADNDATRSSDGRIGPDESFWIGTMGYNLEPADGAHYRYKDGKAIQLFNRVIELPVSQPTCPCFSGLDLKTLYVTSARENLDAKKRPNQPLAGMVLSMPVDVPSIPEFQVKLKKSKIEMR